MLAIAGKSHSPVEQGFQRQFQSRDGVRDDMEILQFHRIGAYPHRNFRQLENLLFKVFAGVGQRVAEGDGAARAAEGNATGLKSPPEGTDNDAFRKDN
jgi:hypothetical protein